jgi:hypothetical protein
MADKTKHLRARIDRLFVLADNCDDYETKAELACFAVVLTSGLVESTCRQILFSYTSKRADRAVLGYVESTLYFFQNPKCTKIGELLKSFDGNIADDFRNDLTEAEAAAIDSIVNNKNNLAHGENPGLGLEVMREYYQLVLSALEKFAKHCK